MRSKVIVQNPLIPPYTDHKYGRELKAMSDILDENLEILDLVEEDLRRGVQNPTKGRPGMTANQALRICIIKQMNGFSYGELAFRLVDSRSYRAFCRFAYTDAIPKKSTLQENLKLIRPETLEAINRVFVGYGKKKVLRRAGK